MTTAYNRQAKRENEAFQRGQLDYKAHKTRGQNPYNPDRKIGQWRAWDEGWEDIADKGA
jgi:hypothetical protein